MPRALDDYLALLGRNEIWLERTKGIGLLSADDAIALAQSGPKCLIRQAAAWPMQDLWFLSRRG